MVRALAFALILAAALSGCIDLAAVQAEAERGTLRGTRASDPVTLVVAQQIDGARLAPRVDAVGVPQPGPGAAPLQRFLRPDAVAVRANDLYLADLGLARVLRVSLATQAMHPLAGAPAAIGVRLRTGGDGSLYVLDPAQRHVLRFALDGKLAQTLAAPGEMLGRPGALAIDERRGLVIVVDLSFNQLVMMPLLGGAAYALINDARHARPGLLDVAAGADGYYALSSVCRCVTLFGTNGAPLSSFGSEDLTAPFALAIDQDERVYVVDGADNSIHIFAAGRQVGIVAGSTLGVAKIAAIDSDQGTLAIADALGARVVLARTVAAPAQGAPK